MATTTKLERQLSSDFASQLDPMQILLIDVVQEAFSRYHAQYPQEVIVNLLQGIPLQNLTIPVVRLGAEYATQTTLGSENNQGRLADPEEMWHKISVEFWGQLLSFTSAKSAILQPFFMAKWAKDPEEAKLTVGDRYNNSPEHFFAENHRGFFAPDLIRQAWKDLYHSGVILMAWDLGEKRCHWQLDENVYQAFENGMNPMWFSRDEADYAKSVFNLAQADK